jgi:hypothetical protein
MQQAQKEAADQYPREKKTIRELWLSFTKDSIDLLWLSTIRSRLLESSQLPAGAFHNLIQKIRAASYACVAVDRGLWTQTIVAYIEYTILQIESKRPELALTAQQYEDLQGSVPAHETAEYQTAIEELRQIVLKSYKTQKLALGSDVQLFQFVSRVVAPLFQELKNGTSLNRLYAIESIAHHVLAIQFDPFGALTLATTPPETLFRDFSLDIGELIRSYRARPWTGTIQFRDPYTIHLALPAATPLEAKRTIMEDRMRLKSVLVQHNMQFTPLTPKIVDNGLLQKYDLNPGDFIYLIGDPHADGLFLLLHIDMLQQAGLLDANYCCRPGFHLFILGDAIARGPDVAWVLNVILALRMRNPLSVHFIHGNHEDLNMAFRCLGNPEWPPAMNTSIDACFSTLPIAVCAGAHAQPPRRKRHFVHFSHALFSTDTQLSPLLKSALSASTLLSYLPHSEPPKDQGAKYQYSYHRLNALELEAATHGATTRGIYPYLWSRVGQRGITGGALVYNLSPRDIQAYSWVSGDKEVQVKFCVRGHGHELFEGIVDRVKTQQTKAIVATIPSGFYGRQSDVLPAQGLGLLLKVGEKASEWTKRLASVQESDHGPRLVLEDREISLYDQIGLCLGRADA